MFSSGPISSLPISVHGVSSFEGSTKIVDFTLNICKNSVLPIYICKNTEVESLYITRVKEFSPV